MTLISKPLSSLPSVAVVILNWNGKQFLEKFLPSVTRSDYTNLTIVVADNASDDDSLEFVRKYYPTVKLVQNAANEGFAKGYNTALKSVTADYYILLNSDVEVTSAWIQPVIELMEKDKSIAVCQPKILSFHEKNKFEYAGAAGGWIDKYGYPFCRGRVFNYCETDEGQYDDTVPVFWASGAAFFVRATVFHRLKGFDERFFAHQEEIDFCWRAQRAGYRVYVVPASVVYHVGGGTLPVGNERKTYLNFRNNLLMLAGNLPFSEKLTKIPYRIILDDVAGMQALAKSDFKTFRAIQRAHWAFIKSGFAKKAKNTIPALKIKTMAGVFNGSIVEKFFIGKKRRFSEIIGFKK